MIAEAGGIRRAQVSATDAVEAVRKFHDAVTQPDMALVLFFCSPEYDIEAVAREMARLFSDISVVGCTTAGEIGPAGYSKGTIAGVSFSTSNFGVACSGIDSLKGLGLAAGKALVHDLLEELDCRALTASGNSFAFLMIDGLSERVESVVGTLQAALGRIPLIGGSAGDGLNFRNTWVYFDRRFHTDSAVLVLVTTPLPFKPIMTQHFVVSDRRIVITAADTEHRLVHEIDGRPAAEAYAELVGVALADLSPKHFAALPLAVVIGGMNYVRSIRQALPNGSLQFFCAVEEGTVMRVASGGDLLNSLEKSFAALRADIGVLQIVIGCDCILRRLEIERHCLNDHVAELLRSNRVVGFNTYGEHYRGVHINQTFVGIAIGTGGACDD